MRLKRAKIYFDILLAAVCGSCFWPKEILSAIKRNELRTENLFCCSAFLLESYKNLQEHKILAKL
jgi:hypothetical protein